MPPKLDGVGVGKSVPSIGRGAKAPVEPAGDARTKFAACGAPEIANVPAVVTGEPEMLNHEGADNPTLVTVPVPDSRPPS
ncbi:MAG TPA: hypothetical protein VGF34_15225 [Stellaceae bacterium]